MSDERQVPAEDLDDIWVQHASVIRGLYLQRQPRLSLREVRNIMMEEHAFPDFKLPTWETKLRDKLRLRKKLKKTDWPIVWRHCVQRGHRGKRSAVYLQGVPVPSKRAWAEIRRQDARASARLNNEPLPVLPTGVEVRSPPPNSPGIPVRAAPECLVSQRPSPKESGQSTSDIGIRDASLPTPWSTNLVTALDGISFESRECLASLPWNTWLNRSRSAVSVSICKTTTFEIQEIPPTFMEYIVMKLSPSTIATSTPLATLAHYTLHSNPDHQITSHFDTYYYLARCLYMFSNRLYDFEGVVGSNQRWEKLRQFLGQLISNIPQRVFFAVLNTRFPSVHATWDCLMSFICLLDRKEELSYLVESGLNHIDWILPYRHELLIHASRLGCADMIMRLLSIEASTEVILPINTRHANGYVHIPSMTALRAAAEGRHAHCFRLLLENCDISKDCHEATSRKRGRWIDCELCFNQAPNSVFCHFLREYSLIPDKFNCEIIATFLEAGADVDAVAPCDYSDFDKRTPIFWSDSSPAGLHTTIAESVFYKHPHFFTQFLRYSRVQQGQISQARLLQAAVESCGALRAYLQTLTTDTSEVNWHLESCLAKAFSLKATSDSSFIGRRIQLIHNLLLSDVDPTLPSICGALSIQSMLNILVLWGQKWIEEQNEPLPQYFIEIKGQLLRHGALWDELDWEHIFIGDSLGILPMLGSLGVEFKSLEGRALNCAAAAGNLEATQWLLDAGVDVNATWTASNKLTNVLLYATEYPFEPAVLQLLLQHGARLPVDIRGNSLARLLHCALRTYLGWQGTYPRVRRDSSGNFYLGMIKVILALGPDMRQPHAGDPDLLEACFIHYPELGDETECCLAAFELLLEHGAPITPSALATAIGLGGRPDLINQLIHTGLGVHSYATERRKVRLDLERPPWAMNQAFSPVQAAVYRNNPKQITLLLEKGADINQPAFNDRGVTALQAACQIEEKPGEPGTRLRMVKFLLELGADADGPPAKKNGFSALQIAAGNGDLEIALILLHRGADPNMLDTADWRAARTALDFATEQSRLDMLQLLLAIGGRSGSPGQTGVDGAIELAREWHCYAIVKYLEAHAESRSVSFPDWIHNRFSYVDAQFGFNDTTQTFL